MTPSRVLTSLSLAAALSVQAQRPDLTGTWVYATGVAPASLPAAPSGVLGSRFGLRMEGASLRLTRSVGDAALVTTMPLDGSRVTSRVPGRLCVGEALLHESASWEADALAITGLGQTPAGGGQTSDSKSRRVVRLETPDRLVVEGTMVLQGQARQVGSVYRRTSDPMPSPRAPHPAASVAATIAQVAWIGATWTGTTGPITTEERWTPPASGAMMATARTLRGGNVASFEFVCIAERDGSLAYIAMPDGRTTPTVFMLTQLTATSATFENPAHDFPTMVRYSQTADGGLETTIAGANGVRAQTVVLTKR